MSDDWDKIQKREIKDFYEYIAPDGYHFESKDGVHYGCVVFDDKLTELRFLARYKLVKDKPFEI